MAPLEQGPLAELSHEVLANANVDESMFMLLDYNAEALNWRLALIDSAQESIDMQYFIWEDNECGRLLLRRLLDAIDRGVRVRILVDDFALRATDRGLATLARHPGLEIRLFNPKLVRRGVVGPLVEMALYFRELNRRMHNKVMLIDGQWAILGGRNIGNPYFGFSKKYNFKDLDVLVTGPVLNEIQYSFQKYWTSQPAYPVDAMRMTITDEQLSERVNEFRQDFRQDQKIFEGSSIRIESSDWQDYWHMVRTKAVPGYAVFITDKPRVKGNRGKRLMDSIYEFSELVEHEAVYVTPYFIPPKGSIKEIESAVDSGVKIYMLTASAGANNHTVAHSHYRKYRRQLLKARLSLYEFDHDPSDKVREMVDTSPIEAKFVALHIKAFIHDRQRLMLGSLNLDPRAMVINTENAILIDSPQLADQLATIVLRMTEPGNAWELMLNEYDGIRWKSGDETRRTQPTRSLIQRSADWFYRLLPIEGQL